MLNLESQAYVRVNATGRLLWERIETPQTIDSLAAELSAEFEIDRQRAIDDVTNFVRAMLERGLVEEAV